MVVCALLLRLQSPQADGLLLLEPFCLLPVHAVQQHP